MFLQLGIKDKYQWAVSSEWVSEWVSTQPPTTNNNADERPTDRLTGGWEWMICAVWTLTREFGDWLIDGWMDCAVEWSGVESELLWLVGWWSYNIGELNWIIIVLYRVLTQCISDIRSVFVGRFFLKYYWRRVYSIKNWSSVRVFENCWVRIHHQLWELWKAANEDRRTKNWKAANKTKFEVWQKVTSMNGSTTKWRFLRFPMFFNFSTFQFSNFLIFNFRPFLSYSALIEYSLSVQQYFLKFKISKNCIESQKFKSSKVQKFNQSPQTLL